VGWGSDTTERLYTPSLACRDCIGTWEYDWVGDANGLVRSIDVTPSFAAPGWVSNLYRSHRFRQVDGASSRLSCAGTDTTSKSLTRDVDSRWVGYLSRAHVQCCHVETS
jgi:hypothetical protein